mgnify:FL=1|jgi:coenzyme Q-binding protein COQ10
MVKFHSKSELPYNPLQLRDLVMDVESYPQFVPNCVAVEIVESEGNLIFADMAISYKGLVESYRSKIHIASNSPEKVEIYVEAISGPFKYLKTSWIINKCNKHSLIDFTIDFSFKSPILNRLMGSVLENMASNMLIAFENRAKKLFEK